jgi:hypothetical protein
MPEHVRQHLEELAIAQALADLIRRYPRSAPRVIVEMAQAMSRPQSH